MNITMFHAAVTACFTVQQEVLLQSAKQWPVGASHPLDLWWREVACKFLNVLRDVCHFLWPSSTPSSQDTSFRHPVPMEWEKKWTVHPDWRRVCINRIWIRFPCSVCCWSKINQDTVWICQKSDLGWQCEQGLRFSATQLNKFLVKGTTNYFWVWAK